MLLLSFGASPARAQAPLCSNLPPGMVSWWRAEGDALDSAGTNHGLALNGVTFAPGKVGQAFSFNYSTNYIPVPTNGLNVGTGDFTVEGWIKTTSVKDYSAILDYDSYNPAIYLRGSGNLVLYPHGLSSAAFFNDGRFHHFAVARTNGQVTYYKDGYVAGTVAGTTPMNAQSIYIGSDLVAGEQFEGLIDELTFYNRALSANEVRKIFLQSDGGKCGTVTNHPAPNAVADYRFEYTLASSVGTPTDLQPINSSAFTNDMVDGSTRTVLAFPLGSGLSLAPTTGLVASNNYSVVMLMRFDAISAYRRILDTYGGITEEGLYSQDGYLRYYPASYAGFSPTIATSQWVQVTFTRNVENFITGYVDGAPQFSAPIAAGSAVIGANNSLRFFRDDGSDLGSGQVARIRVFNSALAPEVVATLDRLAPASTNLPDIALSATNLNFGNVTNGTSRDLSLMISNVGTSTLLVTSLTTNHPAFRVVSPATPFSVGVGAQVAVTMRFSPTTAGQQTGSLAIASSDPDEATLAVALAGNGVSPPPPAPDIALSATNLNFGNVTVGNSTNLTLTVSNVGAITLTITSLTTNNPAFRVVSPPTPFNIGAGAIAAVTLRFTPASAGSQTGAVSIASNDPDEATLAVALAGNGVNPPPGPPDIALSATNLNFGLVTVGSSNNLALTVSNVGASTLTVTSLTTNNSAFRVLSPATPFNVIGGTQAVVTLRFSPASIGANTGAVAIASNDPDEANVSVALTGSGLAAVPRIDSLAPANAAGGATVTLSGTNFGSNPGDVSVRFGGISGVIQSLSSTQIVAIVPFGIVGPVSVTVTVGSQTSAAVAFEVQSSSVTPTQGRITEATLAPSNNVRLVVQPSLPNPNVLLLQSSDSLNGPWWKEPEFRWNTVANGYEFFTPHKAIYPQRYYRFGLFSQSLSSNQTLPYIRFISPNANVRPGLSVSLLGANFAPTPGGNTVRFELPGQSWTAAVTQTATNLVVATVPTNLLTTGSTGIVYRVTVSTAQGTGNGVGCTVIQTTANAFMLRPGDAYITQPPGSGKQRLVVGGGVPPYSLVPQLSNELAIAVASLNGVVLDVVAKTNTKFGSITVRVQDSSAFPQTASAYISVLSLPFAPTFEAAFHTLLGGSAPGLTMTIHAAPTSESFRIEKMELQLQNAGIEVSRLYPGELVGLLKLFYSGTIYDFQQLTVKEVTPGRAKFDVVSLSGGAITTVAEGELIENPPTIVINVPNLSAVSLTPQPLDQELMLADDLLRLPAGAGQSFSVTANFTSVSVREDTYLPLTTNVTRSFTNTVLAAGAPRIDRLLPVHGEVNHNVSLRGAGFGANPSDNAITFAGVGGTRVPADIVMQTNNEIVVTVPRDAVSGPVRLVVAGKISNDFLFFVRFHPDSVLLFNSFTNNVPTPLRLIHQQPVDDGETLGEVSPQTVLCTLNAGHIVVTNLSLNQLVGTALVTSFYTGRQSTNLIVYAGQETNAPQRHIFTEVPNVGSSYVLARLYYSEGTNGVTLQLTGGDALFPLYPGGMYDFQFTAPIYRPPAAVGTDVAVRIETVSQQWMSVPDDFMRLIVNSTRRVR